MASHEISRRVALGAAVIFAGCAGSSSAPVFDYATATGPFHYDVTRTSTTTVETPSGETGSDQALDAMLVVALGGPMEDGRQVTVTFSSLDMRVETMMGDQTFDGAAFVGKPFTGVLHANGTMTITDAPEIEGELGDLFDPSSILRDLLAPLPPEGGGQATPWPHTYEMSQGTVMDFEATYDGTATFAGDSTYEGHATRVIVSTGTLRINAIGTPPGAPGEMEMVLEGPSETTYLWDPAVGVMRAAASTAEGEGEIMTMGFTLPAVTMVESTVILTGGAD